MVRRNPALSASRAKEYLQCPLKFRFSVVDNIPQPPTVATIKGVLVHSVLEELFQLAAQNRTPDNAAALIPTDWEQAVAKHVDYLQVVESESSVNQLLADAHDLIIQYFQMEKPNNIEPAALEAFIEVRLPNGILLRGIVDRVDRARDGRLRVIDYKTGKAPAPRFVNEALFQMRFYALMLRSTDRLPTRLQLLYLKTQSVLTLDPQNSDVNQFEEQLLSLWEKIEADGRSGDFSPKRGPLCGWCPYQSSCPLFGGQADAPTDEGLERLLAIRQIDESAG